MRDDASHEHLLDVLAELVARGGSERLLAPPVIPGEAAFPDPWAPNKSGVALLLRRLLWHAGISREVTIDDRRTGAPPPTERKPATQAEVVSVSATQACIALGLVGEDDVAGTLAHEVGVVHAVMTPPPGGEPYREADAPVRAPDRHGDLERGSIASVYLGLGVLAANAAFQQYSRNGRFNGGYVPLEYDVLRAGHLSMSSLAYLLAVQAVVRAGADARPPAGLRPPQRDEVVAWIAALAPEASQLRERLGIPQQIDAGTRAHAVAFEDAVIEQEAAPPQIAFRWQTHRGGLGLIAGTVLGFGISIVASRGLAPVIAFGSAGAGHVVGRRVRRPRCSSCATIVATDATACPRCGASLRGDIASLSERLEAEERLSDDGV
jgi:hypothetical protein